MEELGAKEVKYSTQYQLRTPWSPSPWSVCCETGILPPLMLTTKNPRIEPRPVS